MVLTTLKPIYDGVNTIYDEIYMLSTWFGCGWVPGARIEQFEVWFGPSLVSGAQPAGFWLHSIRFR